MFNFKNSFLHSQINLQIGKHIKHKEAGVTNIQVAIVTLVGVVLLLGALGGFRFVTQAKVSNEMTTLADLRAAVVRYGQFTGTFTTANTTVPILAGFNAFASSTLTITTNAQATTVTNQWGGTVTSDVGTNNAVGDAIAFTFNGVPKAACRELGTQVDNIAAKVVINATTTKNTGAATDGSSVNTACNTDSNTMIYHLAR